MTANITLSIEIELGWGRHYLANDNKYEIISENRQSETETLLKLLSACDKYQIPISFDVVGHLFHKSCGCHESPHPKSWFESDPNGTVETDPLFYAPDLVKAIRDSSTDHEICSHTYSHVLTDEIKDNQIRWELKQVSKIFKDWNLAPPKSIVLPDHREIPYELLLEHNYDVIRIPIPRTPGSLGNIRKNLSIVSRAVGRQHPVIPPTVENGLVQTYSTHEPSLTAPYLQKGQSLPHRLFRWMPSTVGERLHRYYLRKGVQRAINNKSFAHFWTHLYNMSNNVQYSLIEDFLQYLSLRRDNGEISVLRMKDLRDSKR